MSRVICIAALSLCACGASVYFETDAKGSTTIQGDPLGGLLSSFPQAAGFTNVNLSQSQDFQNQGVKKEDVKSVQLKKLTLNITSPASADWSFLKEMHISVSSSGLPTVEVANKTGIDTLPKSTTLELDVVPNVELKPYVVADSMSITTNVTGHQPSSNTNVDADARFGVNAVVIK